MAVWMIVISVVRFSPLSVMGSRLRTFGGGVSVLATVGLSTSTTVPILTPCIVVLAISMDWLTFVVPMTPTMRRPVLFPLWDVGGTLIEALC